MPPYIRVTANNPSPMTLEGTNSFVLKSHDLASAALIDPGPELANHKAALLAALDCATLTAIILTHRHADHSEMLATAPHWAPGVPIYAVDPQFASGVPPLTDLPDQGSVIEFGTAESDRVRLLPTPGHTLDSISVLHGTTLFAGDTILGRGTTVIMYPEGSVAKYLDSMQLLSELVDDQVDVIEPAHGPRIDTPRKTIDYYMAHRAERLEQIADAVHTVGDIVSDESGGISQAYANQIADVVYAEVAAQLRPAVLASVSAQLEYLRDRSRQ